MLIGYARTSTSDQEAGYEAQLRDLAAAGCAETATPPGRTFGEKVSSVASQRPELAAAMDFAREGDTLVVTKLDRLARSVGDLAAIVKALEAKKVSLKVLAIGLDTGTPTGRLMLNMLGSVAQFEREIMLERQREGVAKAKAKGKYKGRKATARAKTDEIKALAARGDMTREAIAAQLKIGVASVYRALKAA